MAGRSRAAAAEIEDSTESTEARIDGTDCMEGRYPRRGVARMDVAFGFNAMQELTISDNSGDRLAAADMNPASLLGACFAVDS